MNRFLIAIVTVAALCGWILTSSTRATSPPDGTITQVVLPVEQLFGRGYPTSVLSGDLDATFEATPHASGGWWVRGSFRPAGLAFTGEVDGNVSGTARGSSGFATGTSGTILATKLNVSGGNGHLFVLCQLVVDPDGVVWVQQFYLDWLTTGGGGPCTDC